MLAAEALVGEEVGGYRVASVLGRGGMSIVYAAEDAALGRTVALKVLGPTLARRADFRNRFLRESRLAAALDHPNVIPIHEAGEANGLLFIVMRYVRGGDMRTLLRRDAPLEPERALALSAQVASALDAAHARGLVHRDVKPANLLLDDQEHVYLADFGLSQDLDDGQLVRGLRNGPSGTLAYLSPEQVEGGVVDGRADFYALACILYECLTGRTPFHEAESELALLWAHLEHDPPSVHALRPDLPAGIDEVLRRGLAKDPTERFSSCEALVAAAREALERPRSSAGRVDDAGPPLAGRDAELSWLREHWQKARAGAGGIVLLLGARGIGKTRLALELVRDARRDGATVHRPTAGDSAEIAVAIAAAADARSSTLVVVDDLEVAGEEVASELAMLGPALAERRALVIATARRAATSALEPLAAAVPCRRLQPLGRDAVRAIAAVYAGDRAADLPLDALMAATDGVPANVHEIAAEWARAEHVRRVERSMTRARADRSSLHGAHAAIAGEVLELQLARERARLYFPELDDRAGERIRAARSPFKGLAAFDSEDADDFFGRERLVADVVARLASSSLIGLVGPSGSGKSSLLRAGVLPALAGGVLPGSERWEQLLLHPSEHPLAQLGRVPSAEALGDRRIVIAVDQFEEVFTACRSDDQRRAFIDALVAAVRDPAGHAVVLLALRADFYGRVAAHRELAQLLGAGTVLVGPMAPEELRRAIELPVAGTGTTVEPELVEALVADVADEPGALPLLSTALLELWEGRDGRALTLAGYERSGGVRGAVARLAESAYGRLDASGQQLARALFLRLDAGDERTGPVRRRVPAAELDLDGNEGMREVVGTFTARRLLTLSGDGVDVAHEALLREWPRLRAWLAEDAEGRRLHRRLTQAAVDWDRGGREPSDLYRGPRLAAVLDWSAAHQAELNALESEFLDASRAAAERETRRVRRSNRRLRMLLAGTAVLLAVTVAVGGVALLQRGRARTAETVALAERLGAESLVEEQPDRSLLLARQAIALQDTPQTRSRLLAALLQRPAAIRVMRGDGDRLMRAASAPGGGLIAVSDNDETLLLIDPRTYRRVATMQLGHQVQTMRFSRDGRTLAVGASTIDGSVLLLIDVRHRAVRVRHRLPGIWIGAVSFSADGRALATMEVPGVPGQPNRLVLRDPRTGRATGRVATLPDGLGSAAFAGDDRLVASWVDADEGDTAGTTAVLDARTLARLRTIRRGSDALAVSPDGRWAAVSDAEHATTWRLDLRSGERRRFAGRNAGSVLDLGFSPDGRTLVTTGEGDVLVSDVATREPVETLRGHAGTKVFGPAFLPDGATFFTVSLDGSIIAWDLRGTRRLGRPFEYTHDSDGGQEPRLVPAARPDGRAFAIPTRAGRVALWDARSLRPGGPPLRGGAAAVHATYSPDGRTLAVASSEGQLRLFDPQTGRVSARRRIGAASGAPGAVAYRADGRVLAAGSTEGVVLLDPDDARPLGRLRTAQVLDLAFSPDGARLAIGLEGGAVELWHVKRRVRLWRAFADAGSALAVAFAPDGRTIASGGRDGELRIWSTATGRRIAGPVPAHAGFLLTTGYTPDGRLIYTSGTDGVVLLWDARTRRRVGAPLPVSPGGVFATLTSDGKGILAASESGRAVLWDIDPEHWKRHACEVAGRTLTRDEWDDILPGRPYEPACR
ncbi:MAG TPA: protein kinase [Thermoleophilaceae bacterium]|nr:protein kinase [Thermoleophilaceae bacterium]